MSGSKGRGELKRWIKNNRAQNSLFVLSDKCAWNVLPWCWFIGSRHQSGVYKYSSDQSVKVIKYPINIHHSHFCISGNVCILKQVWKHEKTDFPPLLFPFSHHLFCIVSRWDKRDRYKDNSERFSVSFLHVIQDTYTVQFILEWWILYRGIVECCAGVAAV